MNENNNGVLNIFKEALDDQGLKGKLRQDSQHDYNETCLQLPYFPVAYSSSSIDYQHSYHNSGEEFGRHKQQIVDLSLVLTNDKSNCGVWPLSISRNKQGWFLGSAGGAIRPPLYTNGLSEKSKKKITRSCIGVLQYIARKLEIERIESIISIPDASKLSDWHLSLMDKGAKVAIWHNLFVDLQMDIPSIRSFFRKSYKPLISTAEKLWKSEILNSDDREKWNEFRNLHEQVSGRITRSDISWEMQFQEIVNQNAILIILRDDTNSMVGAGFFSYSHDEASYSVAAYDRSLFDKPLGHLVQAKAIEEFKNKKIKWYRIGRRFFQNDLPPPTQKELSISKFKEGFATHVFPEYLLTWDIFAIDR